jgi:hypothetical protein
MHLKKDIEGRLPIDCNNLDGKKTVGRCQRARGNHVCYHGPSVLIVLPGIYASLFIMPIFTLLYLPIQSVQAVAKNGIHGHIHLILKERASIRLIGQ